MTQLRSYQDAAIGAILRQFEMVRSTLLVLPTGTGKTEIFIAVAGIILGRVLILAHRDELIQQAFTRVGTILGTTELASIEKAGQRADRTAKIIIGSVQTMCGARLQSWPSDFFKLIIVDEGHHAVAETTKAILDHFPTAKVLGVTATPDRTDEEALGQIFESVAYRYKLPDAIKDGWLARPRLRRIRLESLDLRRVHTTMGDLNEKELEVSIGNDKVLRVIASSLLEFNEGRKTLVYTPGVDSAYNLAHRLCELRPGCARAVDGKMGPDERRETLAAHVRGDFPILVSCLLLVEGYDSPTVNCIAVARPTKSRSLLTQIIGRGLRTFPGKKDCLILDYTEATRRLDLVGPEDVLGVDKPPEELAEFRSEPLDGPVDILAHFDEISFEIHARLEREAELFRQRRKAAEDQKKKARTEWEEQEARRAAAGAAAAAARDAKIKVFAAEQEAREKAAQEKAARERAAQEKAAREKEIRDWLSPPVPPQPLPLARPAWVDRSPRIVEPGPEERQALIESNRQLLDELKAERGSRVIMKAKDAVGFVRLVSRGATVDRRVVTEQQILDLDKLGVVPAENLPYVTAELLVDTLESRKRYRLASMRQIQHLHNLRLARGLPVDLPTDLRLSVDDASAAIDWAQSTRPMRASSR